MSPLAVNYATGIDRWNIGGVRWVNIIQQQQCVFSRNYICCSIHKGQENRAHRYHHLIFRCADKSSVRPLDIEPLRAEPGIGIMQELHEVLVTLYPPDENMKDVA